MRGRTFSLPHLSLETTLALSVAFMASLFSCSKPISTFDLSMFMQMGAWMWEHHRLLEVEPFAISVLGDHFLNGTWLSQVVLYGTYHAGGYPALRLLDAAIVATTLLIVAMQIRPFGPRVTVLGICVTFAFMLQNLGIRPQMFSFPLFAMVHLLTTRYPNRRATPLLLFAIMAIWVNLHGAFPIALGFPVVYGLQALVEARLNRAETTGASPHRWLFLLLVMTVATLINPYGPKIYGYFLQNSSLPATRGLVEWLPPSPTSFLGGRFFLVAAVVAGLLLKKRHTLRLCDAALFIGFTLLGASSQRMIVWWGLVTPFILARSLASGKTPARHTATTPRLHTGLGWAMIGFWLLLWAKTLPGILDTRPGPTGDYRGLDDDTPARVATYLASHGHGRMFHRLEWGGYLTFRLWPSYQPFIDIRVWIFPDTVWNSYLAASRGEPGWEELMVRYGIDTLVLCRERQGGLIEAAAANRNWREIYDDDQAVVFVSSTLKPGRSRGGYQ